MLQAFCDTDAMVGAGPRICMIDQERRYPFYSVRLSRICSPQSFISDQPGGYNGSTCTLTYDAASDQLKGVYYQVVARQKFQVVFVRAK